MKARVEIALGERSWKCNKKELLAASWALPKKHWYQESCQPRKPLTAPTRTCEALQGWSVLPKPVWKFSLGEKQAGRRRRRKHQERQSMTSKFFTRAVQEPSAVLLLGRAEAGKSIWSWQQVRACPVCLLQFLPSTAKGIFFSFLPRCPGSLLLSALPASRFGSLSCSSAQCSVGAVGCGMVTWWAAAQHLPWSLRKARLLTTLALKHFAGSQRLTPTGIIDSLWKVLSTGERKETKLEKLASIFRWLILFFLYVSHFVSPDYISPASHHSTECKFNPSSQNLVTLQSRTSLPRSWQPVHILG